jgi:hypothetical protein
MHKIIIVEDEEIIRNGLAISFDWMDYGCNIVGLAKDGKEGLDMIMELEPDIVISDIKMPKMTGIEMIQNAKKQGKDFFSIILTSYAEFGYAKSAIEFGASGYLLKPVDEDELVELLKSITDKINKKNRQKKIEESVKDKIIEKEDDWKIFLKAGESSDAIISSVYNIIQSKYTERLSINDVADELKVSNSYISRKLKTKLNTSFVDLLSQYRIKKAISYLEKTDLMIYEISCKAGFSDYKYFCTVFKKYTSLSPSEYQKDKAKR